MEAFSVPPSVRRLAANDALGAGCVAVVLAGCCLVTGYTLPESIAAAAICTPLAWRSRRPLVVLAAVLLASVAYILLVIASPVYVLPLGFALYTVAANGSRRRTLAIGLLLAPGVVLITVTLSPDSGGVLDQSLELLFQLGFALAVGEAVRSGREVIVALRRRNEDETRRRVDAERMRIARDVHDVVSHSLATISTQASVATYLGARAPEGGAKALREIGEISDAALADLRHALGGLRGDPDEPPLRPAPSLRDLPAMVERARGSGLSIELTIAGPPDPLPTAVELAVFRIVQECLTNAMRHASGAGVSVAIAIAEGEVRVDVVDDGAGQAREEAQVGTGSGLIGMRERASALGGELMAGTDSGGGFRVRAVLPVGSAR